MKQLFSYLLVWGILIASLVLVANLLTHFQSKQTAQRETRTQTTTSTGTQLETDTAKLAQLRTVYRRAVEAYKNKDYFQSLNILQEIETELGNSSDYPDTFKRSVYHLKGGVHWSLWQYIDAEKAWVAALEYAKTRDEKNKLSMLLNEAQRVLEAVNDERAQRQVYLASPHSGPAASLTGKVVLIYLFIKDKNSGDWSLRNRTHTINTWQRVEKWITNKAEAYGSKLDFSKRLFLLDRQPDINRLRVGDVSQQFMNVEQVVNTVARHFGYSDILAFTNKIKQEEQADQAIVILHLAKGGRSFASRCMGYCGKGNSEFVFLMEQTNTKHWQALEYAQAHESLHLFGADDLYNISKARNYAIHDIMNYPSSLLWGSSMEDITAYATGLKKNPPNAPFKIKTFTH